VPCLAFAQSVIQELEIEQHQHVLQGAWQTGNELARHIGRRELEHMLDRRLDLLEVFVHDPAQSFRILLKGLGNEGRVEKQMKAALSAVEEPLRVHLCLPHPTPSWRAFLGHHLLIGRRGSEIELQLHESCR